MRNRAEKYLGFLPLFSGPCMESGFLTAGIVLAIMVIHHHFRIA